MIWSATEGTAWHLPWFVIAMLALWLPPAIYAVIVYRSWSDPMTITAVVELVCLAAALPGLFSRRVAAWRLVVWSRFIVLVQTLWVVLLNARLNGFIPTLWTKPVVEAGLGLLVAAFVLVSVRGRYR